MAFNIGDYVKVKEDLIVGDKYGLIICDEHDQYAGQVVKIAEIVGEKPNLFYKLEGDAIYMFSKEMLTPATMDEIEKLSEVVVVEVKAPEIRRVEADDEVRVVEESFSGKLSPEEYVSRLKRFVDKYREVFKDEDDFWGFFYEKATTEMYLWMKGITVNDFLNVNENKGAQKEVKKKK